MSVKQHYDDHLANFYDWMVGDFDLKQKEQQDFFISNHIKPFNNRVAIDLGAGHGLQSVSLANLGYKVKAIDFNKQLLAQLKQKAPNLEIEIIEDDLVNFPALVSSSELIVCMGDTIAHIESLEVLDRMICDCYDNLCPSGKLVLSYRDYSEELKGDNRYIPVKSDSERILTCVLDYSEDKVHVTDLLYENVGGDWQQKVSSYEKIRVSKKKIETMLENVGFDLSEPVVLNRMIYSIATKH